MANELILIVEDNEKNRKLARDVLQFKGFRTLDAVTGEEGVALAKRFVELHGGTMRLTSEPGKGSTFIFTLPVSQQGRAPAEDTATPAIADTAVQPTTTI